MRLRLFALYVLRREATAVEDGTVHIRSPPILMLRSCPRNARTASRSMDAGSAYLNACCSTAECVAILRDAIVAARRWLLRMRAEAVCSTEIMCGAAGSNLMLRIC